MNAAVPQVREIVAEMMRDAQGVAATRIRNGLSIDLGDFEDQLAGNLEPVFRDMFRAGFGVAGIEVDGDIEVDPFDLPNAEAVEAAQRSIIRQTAKDITDTTAQMIERQVAAGIEAGKPIDDIAKAIEDDTGFSDTRSELIARTETQNAANAGKFARYKDAGVTLKVWVPGTSTTHRALGEMFKDGIPIDEPFIRAGQTITAGGQTETFAREVMFPPARPNCTCTFAPKREDD